MNDHLVQQFHGPMLKLTQCDSENVLNLPKTVQAQQIGPKMISNADSALKMCKTERIEP